MARTQQERKADTRERLLSAAAQLGGVPAWQRQGRILQMNDAAVSLSCS